MERPSFYTVSIYIAVLTDYSDVFKPFFAGFVAVYDAVFFDLCIQTLVNMYIICFRLLHCLEVVLVIELLYYVDDG